MTPLELSQAFKDLRETVVQLNERVTAMERISGDEGVRERLHDLEMKYRMLVARAARRAEAVHDE